MASFDERGDIEAFGFALGPSHLAVSLVFIEYRYAAILRLSCRRISTTFYVIKRKGVRSASYSRYRYFMDISQRE